MRKKTPKRLLTIFIIIFLRVTVLADQATQTDWSGGDGKLGSVTRWENEFYTSDGVSWLNFPGQLYLGSTPRVEGPIVHTVDDSRHGIHFEGIHTADIDGDEDLDLIVGLRNFSKLVWYKNDSSGRWWSKNTIRNEFYVYAELPADIDDDGDIDVVATEYDDGKVVWFENVNGDGLSWTEHTVGDNYDGAANVHVIDMDNDEDLDIIADSWLVGTLDWWEQGESGGSITWTKHNIDEPSDPTYIQAGDLDGDGDVDVVASYYNYSNKTSWWENLNGSGTSWDEHLFDTAGVSKRLLRLGDIDRDGDLDLVASRGALVWYENDGDGFDGNTGIHEISEDYEFQPAINSDIELTDITGDGNLDVAFSDFGVGDVVWWDNADGDGTSWSKYIVANAFDDANALDVGDIDGDYDIDIVCGAADSTDEILWWEVTEFEEYGYLISTTLDTQTRPNWGNIDWSPNIVSGTTVKFRVRSFDNNEPLVEWSDYIISPGSLSPYLTDGDRFMQYEAVLETMKKDVTPELKDITITWTKGEKTGLVGLTFALSGPKPNPSKGMSTISFAVPDTVYVKLALHDISGRAIRSLHEGITAPGVYEIGIAGLSPGVYMYRLEAAEFNAAKKLVVIK